MRLQESGRTSCRSMESLFNKADGVSIAVKLSSGISDKQIMIALWIVVGLVVSAASVSLLAAAFSVSGLADLFSGAVFAVVAMSSSLELAKFVLAAYLHQAWNNLNLFLKVYLASAIVVLSLITSMGIFGFLSNAYQSSSNLLEGETIKINGLKGEQARLVEEINRLNRAIDEIPASRITRKMKARQEVEPVIASLRAKGEELAKQITEADLKILEVKKKVGPLIYVSRAFKVDIDEVVKYLILTFVFVFDPLAICLVLATSQATMSRRRSKSSTPMQVMPQPMAVAPENAATGAQADAPAAPPESGGEGSVSGVGTLVESPTAALSPPTAEVARAPEAGEVIQMRIVDENEEQDKDAV